MQIAVHQLVILPLLRLVARLGGLDQPVADAAHGVARAVADQQLGVHALIKHPLAFFRLRQAPALGNRKLAVKGA